MAYGNRFTQWIYSHSPSPVWDLMTTVYSHRRSRVKYGPKFYQYLAGLERSQWYSKDELQLLQDDKLRRLISYGINYVPYYRGLFQELGMGARDIATASDLRRLPYLDKSIVQDRLDEFRSVLYRDSSEIHEFQSSGTTGRAIDVFVTQDCLQMEKAFKWLHCAWGGVQQGDPAAAFVGFPVVPVQRTRPPFWVHDKAENRAIFSLRHMSKANLPAYAEHLAELRPLFILGYPTAIYLIALFLCDAGIESIRPRAVFTSSETLMDHQRSVIEQAFGSQVFDWYGAVECIANIVQCEYGSYHIKYEYGVVEILDPDGAPTPVGQVGELVCTGLNNYAMPFIRYRVGDMAVPAEGVCPCGRGGQLVERITGRTEDVIVTPDGRYLSRLDFVFKGMHNVEEAQMIQDDYDHLRVRVVRRLGYTEQDTTHILSNLREWLGEGVHIELEPVERIPRTASGKFRYVISRVPIDLGGAWQTGEVLALTAEEERTL